MRLFHVVGMVLCAALAGPLAAAPLKIVTILGAPWGFVGADGKPAGIMVEIGNRIAEEAGFAYTNALVPYARTAVEMETGGADMLLRFSNAHLGRIATPVAVVVSMPVIAVGPRGSQFNEVADLRGKQVGVVRTSKYVDAFDNDAEIRKYPVNDYVTMTRMVAARRLDAGVGSDVGFYYGAYMAGVKPEELGVPLVLGNNEFVLFLSKQRAGADQAALKAAVARLVARGDIKRIVERYALTYAAYRKAR